MKHYHAAIAASFLSCAIAAMRSGAPAPRPLVPAAKMVSADAQAVRAGQGKKRHPDQPTRAIIDVVRAVRAVRAKFTTSHTCARARVCEYLLLSSSFFFSIKESTLTTLTKPMTVGFFALTKHPDQA
jgi:hypothetical protein